MIRLVFTDGRLTPEPTPTPDPAEQLHASITRAERVARMMRMQTDLQLMLIDPAFTPGSRDMLRHMLELLSHMELSSTTPMNRW
jgi:hypothetical protein